MEQRITQAAEKYGLTQLHTVSLSQDKAVVFAQSETHGAVVLKLDTDWVQLEDAYRMLEELSSCGACSVIHFEKVLQQISRTRKLSYGVMLCRRINPGSALRKESSAETRIRVFCSLFRKIHQVDYSGTEYMQWLDGIVKYCQMYCSGSELEKMALKAYHICVELYKKYPCVFRLHGDLHHDNILLNEDGNYLFIDPKAVIGPEILDTPRFLLNELGMEYENAQAHILWCIDRLHQILGYPQEDLRKAFYMETVLANIWRMEDGGKPKYDQLQLAERILQ